MQFSLFSKITIIVDNISFLSVQIIIIIIDGYLIALFTYSLLFKQSKSGSTFSIAKMENGEGATIIKQTMEKIMFQVYCFLEKDRSCVGGGFQQLLRHSNVDSNVDWLFRSKRRGTSEASNCFNYSTGKGRDKEKTELTRTRKMKPKK